MNSVFEYSNYRTFLRDWYTEEKERNRHVSHRFVGAKLGLKSSGHFSLILQGKSGVSPDLTLRIAKLLKLKKRESEFFECLVHYNQAKTYEQKRHWFERLIAFNESTVLVFDATKFEYYDTWYYSVIHRILDYHPFKGDYTDLARQCHPSISTQEARKAIDVLEKLGLVRKDANGCYVSSEKLVSTGYDADSVAITSFIRKSLDQAKEAMDNVSRKERNFSTVTFSVSRETFQSLEEEIRAFRRKLMAMVKADEKPERVYQFNMQIFPVSRGDTE